MTLLVSQNGRMLLNLKRVRELNIVEQSIVVLTDYGTEIRVAEYGSDRECERAMLELTKDIWINQRLVFLRPAGGVKDDSN